jgi:hypothetical protein
MGLFSRIRGLSKAMPKLCLSVPDFLKLAICRLKSLKTKELRYKGGWLNASRYDGTP